MRTQMLILVFLCAINVVAFMVLNAQTGGAYIFPFVGYSHGVNQTGTLEDYEDNFNSTGTVEAWQPSGSFGFAGDIFGGLNLFWNTFRFLIDGFGMTLEWVGSFIPAGQGIFVFIATALRVLFGIMFVTLVIEIITGRSFFD